MAYIISMLLLILCFKYKDSKKVFIGMFVWMWILFAFSKGNSDYAMYRNLYISYGRGPLTFDTNFLFVLAARFCYIGGFNYNTFLAMYGLVRTYIDRRYNL